MDDHAQHEGVEASPSRTDVLSVPASEHSTLRLMARTGTSTYHNPASFTIEVVFENHGSFPVRIFPAALYRHYRPVHQETVAFVPRYSGSRSFWSQSFAVPAFDARSITLQGMKDRGGYWGLLPGEYRLSLRYVVTAEQVATVIQEGPGLDTIRPPIWIGEIESREVAIRYDPHDDAE